jgi:hypothetical protein
MGRGGRRDGKRNEQYERLHTLDSTLSTGIATKARKHEKLTGPVRFVFSWQIVLPVLGPWCPLW